MNIGVHHHESCRVIIDITDIYRHPLQPGALSTVLTTMAGNNLIPVARGGTGASAFTANYALVSNASGNIVTSAITATQLGYPYAVPLSYVYYDSKLYFHCAKTGHKLDAIANNENVSFCVIAQDNIVPEEYTTYFRSVIVFGKARILNDESEKRLALEVLAARYSPDHEQGRLEEIDKLFKQVCLVEIAIEHMSGKESIELVRAKQ